MSLLLPELDLPPIQNKIQGGIIQKLLGTWYLAGDLQRARNARKVKITN